MLEGVTLEDVKNHVDWTIMRCAENRRLLPLDDFVYVIGETCSDHTVKVGHANYIDTRLISLQIGNPRRLEVKYAFRTDNKKLSQKIEGRVHQHLWSHHISGEWFSVSAPAAADYIGLISGLQPESLDSALKARETKRDEYRKLARQIRHDHWPHIIKLMRGDRHEMLGGSRLSQFILSLDVMKNRRRA